MTRPLAVGIVGAGTIAQMHADALLKAGHTLAAVCDIRRENAASLAERHEAAVYVHHQDLIAHPDLDAVIIAAPNALHSPIALDAIRAGRHVLIEKPIATSVGEARQLVSAAHEAGVQLAVGHVLRFVPSLIQSAALIRSGVIGEPVLINERRASSYEVGTRPGWFFDTAQSGGGILMNVGTHAIDRIQWFGGADVREVVGYTFTPGGNVDTEVTALLILENGVRASLTVTGTGLPFIEELSVIGKSGALLLDRANGTRVYQRGQLVDTSPPIPDEMAVAFAAQFTAFADAIDSGGMTPVDGTYGLGVLAVAEAIYTSSAIGAPVDVALSLSEEALA